jgi:hypothetical protein
METVSPIVNAPTVLVDVKAITNAVDTSAVPSAMVLKMFLVADGDQTQVIRPLWVLGVIVS